MNKKLSALSAAACLAGLMGFAGPAHAAFTVTLDCHGANGQPAWANTANTITVKAKINNVWNTLVAGARNCAVDGSQTFSSAAFLATNVQAVSVETNGTDNFFLDKITLNGNVTRTNGVNNNFGWCFSMTRADGANSFCDSNIAVTKKDNFLTP